MASRRLLDHLRSVGNKSGSIPPAAVGLGDLKAAIRSMPMDVSVPGMSQLVSAVDLVDGIVSTLRELGNLSSIGEFRNILGKVASELGTGDLTKVDPDRLAEVIRRVVPLDDLKAAVGPAGALLMSATGRTRE